MQDPERAASPLADQSAPERQHSSLEIPPEQPVEQLEPAEPVERVGGLVDSTLLEEITLLSDVITDVAGYSGHLDPEAVDHVLGVDEPVS
ncbi:hypothetical protein [Terrabacter sp. NPDC080008]|uniref:hypothetical protein n=1 Tax=Terrabacter sp. NPDC080008 TaxID=3155176 RepID=UPI00345087ED